MIIFEKKHIYSSLIFGFIFGFCFGALVVSVNFIRAVDYILSF